MLRDAAARGGQGPPHRAALEGRTQPGRPLRRRGPAPVRAGARPRPAGPRARLGRPVLGRRPALGRARGAAQLRHRVSRRGPGRAPALGPRPGRHLPRQGGRRRRPAPRARGRARPLGVALLYGARLSGGAGARRGLCRRHSSAWPPWARSTASSPPACGSERRSSRCSFCPWSLPSCSRRRRPGTRPSPGTPGRAGGWLDVLAVFAVLYIADRDRRLRPALGGRMSTPRAQRPERRALDVALQLARARSPSRSGRDGLAGPVRHAHRTSSWATSCACSTSIPPMAWVAFLAFGVASAVEPALPVAEDARRALRPPRRSLRRGRRRLHRPHARLRLDLGPPDLGGLVGLGPAADHDGAVVRALSRLPGSPAACRASFTPVPGDRPSRRSIAFVDVPVVYFSVEWWRSLHQAPTVEPDHRTRPTCTARWPGPCCSASSRSRSCTSGSSPTATASPSSRTCEDDRGARACARRAPGRGGRVSGYVEAGYVVGRSAPSRLRRAAWSRRERAAPRRRFDEVVPGGPARWSRHTGSRAASASDDQPLGETGRRRGRDGGISVTGARRAGRDRSQAGAEDEIRLGRGRDAPAAHGASRGC